MLPSNPEIRKHSRILKRGIRKTGKKLKIKGVAPNLTRVDKLPYNN
jgi:hypothetical protein